MNCWHSGQYGFMALPAAVSLIESSSSLSSSIPDKSSPYLSVRDSFTNCCSIVLSGGSVVKRSSAWGSDVSGYPRLCHTILGICDILEDREILLVAPKRASNVRFPWGWVLGLSFASDNGWLGAHCRSHSSPHHRLSLVLLVQGFTVLFASFLLLLERFLALLVGFRAPPEEFPGGDEH
jgi:hypothetical protein